MIYLVLLLTILPFEPRSPLFVLFGFEASFLELAAAVSLLAAALELACCRSSKDTRLYVGLGCRAVAFLIVCLLSTAFAAPPRLLPFKFTLRVGAGVTAFFLTAWTFRRRSLRPFLLGFALAGAIVAGVSLAEELAFSTVAPWLSHFREHQFEVGGIHRVAATFAYPNVAGGFLVLTLPPALYFAASRESSRAVAVAAATGAFAMFQAALWTYSRGALFGAFAAAATLFLVARRSPRASARRLAVLLAGFVVSTILFGAKDPTFRWRTGSEGDASWYRAEVDPAASDLFSKPGELLAAEVEVTNVGRLTWESRGDKPIHLGYRWFTVAPGGDLVPHRLEGERTRLDRPIPPGETARLRALVRAPEKEGRYVLMWDMVHEHTTWFSDKDGSGRPVRFIVGPKSARALIEPADLSADLSAMKAEIQESSWRPGRLELWSLAIDLFRERPLLGVGPDNFRWLHGRAAGKARWDTRTFANSLYLELLATTGLLGLAAFTGLVTTSIRGALRQGPRARDPLHAGALAASLLGFLAHGVFDYLLELTPIYLAFWMLLGAIAAARAGEEA